MRKLTLMIVCSCALLFSGCSFLSTALTPAPVTDAVARGYTVSRVAVETPPTSAEDLKAYFEINAELWKQLAEWYELIPQEE